MSRGSRCGIAAGDGPGLSSPLGAHARAPSTDTSPIGEVAGARDRAAPATGVPRQVVDRV